MILGRARGPMGGRERRCYRTATLSGVAGWIGSTWLSEPPQGGMVVIPIMASPFGYACGV